MDMNSPKKSYSLAAATSFVIASMIGVGVFTSLGYQLASTKSAFSIALLWSLGGISALCGALSYLALAHLLPRSGGEYHFLKNIYGEGLGFVTGILTIVVGFAAPIAATAMAFHSYTSQVFPETNIPWAVILILIVLLVHLFNVKSGGTFNVWATALKVLLIFTFILFGFNIAEPFSLEFMPKRTDVDQILSSGFGVSLVYVTYSYTGWNAAVYMLDEIENPKRNVPLAILFGTLIVTFIYILINVIFMYSTPVSEMVGQTEVAAIAGKYIFGREGSRIVSALIAFGLIATVSSMLVSASRVLKRMGEDSKLLSFVKKESTSKVPYIAILLIGLLSYIFLFSASFDEVIEYAGFILSFFGLITVIGLFILKSRNKNLKLPFGRWFWPVIPMIYLLIKVLIISYMIIDNPRRIIHVLITFGLGYFVYGINRLFQHQFEN